METAKLWKLSGGCWHEVLRRLGGQCGNFMELPPAIQPPALNKDQLRLKISGDSPALFWLGGV